MHTTETLVVTTDEICRAYAQSVVDYYTQNPNKFMEDLLNDNVRSCYFRSLDEELDALRQMADDGHLPSVWAKYEIILVMNQNQYYFGCQVKRPA